MKRLALGYIFSKIHEGFANVRMGGKIWKKIQEEFEDFGLGNVNRWRCH